MFKKFYVAIFFAVILSLLVGSVAFAQTSQEESGLRGGRRGIGQITALGDGQLTIISRRVQSTSFMWMRTLATWG
ncbi:MAG TPA: hypothetical protein VLA49_21415 [Anaerolineales bacterium]|nr:hypothetical protein [Anaerolineales bacterium]